MEGNVHNTSCLSGRSLSMSDKTNFSEGSNDYQDAMVNAFKGNDVDIAIRKFLANFSVIFDTLTNNSTNNDCLNLKLNEIQDINNLLHITNFVINSSYNTNACLSQVNTKPAHPMFENKDNIPLEELSASRYDCRVTQSDTTQYSNTNLNFNSLNASNNTLMLKNKSLPLMNLAILTCKNKTDLSFLNDFEIRTEDRDAELEKSRIMENSNYFENLNINSNLKAANDGSIDSSKTKSPLKIKRRTKFRLDRVKNKIKTMVNNFIHKNLLLITKREDIFLFKLPKDVVQRIKIQKYNEYFNKTIKEIYSTDSFISKESKRTSHNKRTVYSCSNREFQLYLGKKYKDLMDEYVASWDYPRDINELSKKEEPEYVALLKKILTKACQ